MVHTHLRSNVILVGHVEKLRFASVLLPHWYELLRLEQPRLLAQTLRKILRREFAQACHGSAEVRQIIVILEIELQIVDI